MKVDILAFGAHPDDVELSCVGTLLDAIHRGKKVGIVDLTQGELGTRGSGPLRLVEAENSRQLMGATYRHNLDMGDGFFEINEKSLLQIIQEIRFGQPELVLANSIDDRHPDHGRASELVHRACFLAGLTKIKTTFNGLDQEAWRPKSVFYYIQDKNLDPDFVIDISSYMDTKIECIKCFSSQFYDPNSDEPDTPLTGDDYFDFIKGKAKSYGRHIGAGYAEGFNTRKYLGVKNIMDLY